MAYPSYYYSRKHLPYLTNKQKATYIILGLLLAPIGIGITLLLVPLADAYRKHSDEPIKLPSHPPKTVV